MSIGTSVIYSNEMELNTDRPGGDYREAQNISSAEQCQAICDGEEPCKSWTFVKPNTIHGPRAHCYLKNIVARKVDNTACISGVSSASLTEVQRVVIDNYRDIKFRSSRKALWGYSTNRLRRIIDTLHRSNDSKLIIFVKPKTGGLAKRRVKTLKSFFSNSRSEISSSKYTIRTARAYSSNSRYTYDNGHLIFDVIRR